jgi:hypothetical protein
VRLFTLLGGVAVAGGVVYGVAQLGGGGGEEARAVDTTTTTVAEDPQDEPQDAPEGSQEAVGEAEGRSEPGTVTTAPSGSGPAPTAAPRAPAPTTSPPQTSPPQTSPPQTSPPQTAPPTTSPPTTATTQPPVGPHNAWCTVTVPSSATAGQTITATFRSNVPNESVYLIVGTDGRRDRNRDGRTDGTGSWSHSFDVRADDHGKVTAVVPYSTGGRPWAECSASYTVG